uniref:Minor head protein n=1 Tax=Salmonella phage vB_SEnST11_KE22 TaxID=3161173 RepID=A0AAU8GEF5_9CAUD
MAGYRLIGRNRLIPRPTFTGRHRQYAKVDTSNPYENQGVEIEYEEFDVLECVVQPLTGKAARDYTSQLMQEGGRQYDSFTVYSSVMLRGPVEGSNELADQIKLMNSRGEMVWFTVIKSDAYQTTGVARFRAYVVSVPEGTNGGI